jgi:hypothetical protein
VRSVRIIRFIDRQQEPSLVTQLLTLILQTLTLMAIAGIIAGTLAGLLGGAGLSLLHRTKRQPAAQRLLLAAYAFAYLANAAMLFFAYRIGVRETITSGDAFTRPPAETILGVLTLSTYTSTFFLSALAGLIVGLFFGSGANKQRDSTTSAWSRLKAFATLKPVS